MDGLKRLGPQDEGPDAIRVDMFRWVTAFLCVVVGGWGVAAEMVFGQTLGLKIQSIGIEGNQRIEDSAILGRLTVQPGDHITTIIARQQIQRIYDMGFFDDVQVRTESIANGVLVIFLVKEKPFTVDIVFDGNEELSDDKLKEVVTLQSQVFLDKKEVKASAEKIREEYQIEGYHHAKVIPIVQALDDTRNRITFFIQEGTRARIHTIVFAGMTVVSKSDLLGVMANREWVPVISLLRMRAFFVGKNWPTTWNGSKSSIRTKGTWMSRLAFPALI